MVAPDQGESVENHMFRRLAHRPPFFVGFEEQKRKDFLRSLQSRIGFCFPPGKTITITTLTLTQILKLHTLAKALPVHNFLGKV